MNSKIKLALKILLVSALLYLLAKKCNLSVEQTGRAITNWQYSVPGACVFILTSFLGVIRWQILLKAHDIKLPFWRTFQLTYIGVFFNIALPGAVSGDLIKAFYVGKESEGRKTKAFGSILFDRVAGLSALVVLSASAFVIAMAGGSDSGVLRALQMIITLAAAVVFVFYGYLFLVKEHHDPVLRILKTIKAKFKKLGFISDVYEALRHYHSHRLAVLQVLALSLVIHLAIGWGSLEFARALGDTQLSLVSLYVVVPLGLLAIAVPVLPGGIGTGHAAFAWLFTLLGSQSGANIFTIYVLTQMIVSGFGGLIYLRFRASEPVPTVVATA